MQQVSERLRRPEILKIIGAEASLGNNWASIARKLEEENNLKASPLTIKKAYDIYATRKAELVATSPELNSVIKKEILNSTDQLKSINNIMWKLITDLKDSDNKKDVKLVIQIAREIREQIKINNEMSKSFIDSLDPTKINKIEYTKVVINSLKDLESSGIITINKEAARVLEMKDFID